MTVASRRWSESTSSPSCEVCQPHVANARLKALRALMKYAIDIGLRQDDPTIGIKKSRVRVRGSPLVERGGDREVRGTLADRHDRAVAPRRCCSAPRSAAPISCAWAGNICSGAAAFRQDKTDMEMSCRCTPSCRP